MKYQTYTFNPIQENTYLIWDEETLEAAIIDAGMWNRQEEQMLEGSIAAHGLKMKYALQTHAHFDHTFGLPFLYRTYGLKPIFNVAEAETYRDMPMMGARFGLTIADMPPVGRFLDDGSKISFGGIDIQMLHTPGHTPGSVAYYIPSERLVFSGDTLFRQSIGRTDLPGGNFEDELKSIKEKLFSLPDETIVLSGHGPSTTIGWEKKHNYCV